jgi:hypothetical protein
MAKRKPKDEPNSLQPILAEVQQHYQEWTEDRDIRMTRENGWDDILDAYFGRLPDNWPYLSQVVDPRLRTTIIEKKARLTNSKLRGRLVPREGADIVTARINNALLDFQWDNAQDGGSMNHKWGLMDQDTRLFGSDFGLATWKYCEYQDDNGETKVEFNGNEFKPLDVRNVGLTHGDNVRNAKWVQVSDWVTFEELENENEMPDDPKYPGLAELKGKLTGSTQDRRDANYISRIKSLKGLDDRLGQDKAFPVIEVVTEYRKDRWITFSPKHNVLLRDIPNPYKHGKIPIVQLKYFPLSDDPWGESEVESVLPLWRAIQATINGFLDTMNIHMKPPLKIIEGLARMETIEWGPEAQWIINQENAVTEHVGSGEPLRYFQTTYSSLVAAFNTAMGDSSQGIGGVDPFNPDKTATEINKQAAQQNVRDQDNQNALSDALKDMMSMWLSNNQQFLFANPDMSEYILKIIGEKDFAFFKRAGMADMVLDNESSQTIADAILAQNGDVNDLQMQELMNAAYTPAYPVVENPGEKDVEKLRIKPKMKIDDTGTEAEISMVPEDLNGTFNYVPDVKSMGAGADQEMQEARKQATDLLFNNQNVLALLQQEGKQPNASEILTEIFESSGTRDASRFFTDIKSASPDQGAAQAAGVEPPLAQPGLPTSPTPDAQAGQQMGGPPLI